MSEFEDNVNARVNDLTVRTDLWIAELLHQAIFGDVVNPYEEEIVRLEQNNTAKTK